MLQEAIEQGIAEARLDAIETMIKKKYSKRGYSWLRLYRCGISGGWTETSGCQLKGLVV